MLLFSLVLAAFSGAALAASSNQQRNAFVDKLLSNLTVPELVHQIHLAFADNIIGPLSHNELYDSYIGNRGIGVIHDWYPTNTSQFNDLQTLNAQKMRVPIPFMQTGECLHAVGSFKGTVFPQQVGMAATFDPDLVYKVGRAIGTEARAIGIHACFSPVLDLGKEPRWGRVQEDFGEDYFLTSMIGMNYAKGLSKNGSWSSPDAVIPVMKHFAGHGSPSGGVNAAPYTGFGLRQVMTEMLTPFKAAVQLGGVKGVMMAYHDIDGVPSVVNPILYDALADWGFDGFIISDDIAVRELVVNHFVASSPADAVGQWLNAGGEVQFYDYPLDLYTTAIQGLVDNGIVHLATLKERVRGVLNAKWDLGLFDNPFIPTDINATALADSDDHRSLALEAAQSTLVLLENRNETLPLDTSKIKKIALVGPFADTMNYGDYAGQWGATPIDRATTVRAAMEVYASRNGIEVITEWGANSWLYNAQYPISPDLLSTTDGETGGLRATYFADTNFSQPVFTKVEPPNRDWGLYPPNGLPSNNFSVVYEGKIRVASNAKAGWIGLAIGPNSTAKLFVDNQQLVDVPLTLSGNVLGNILPLEYSEANGTSPPPGSHPFQFTANSTHDVRIEFQTWNLAQKFENVNSVNAQIELYWNLVDPNGPGDVVSMAKDADVIVYVGGAGWNSDGENGDRATMDLAPAQGQLVDQLLDTGKPVVVVLEGGRPFAIADVYSRAAAVMLAYFPGQAGGQAIADALFGTVNPGGRLSVSIPSTAGAVPAYYNYKHKTHGANYTDVHSFPLYPFGFGQSYTTFARKSLRAQTTSSSGGTQTFSSKSPNITFFATIQNTGTLKGSYTAQVYLLQRISSIAQPIRQLVGFQRMMLNPGEEREVAIEFDAERYLSILNRQMELELERGSYTFALCNDGGGFSDTSINVMLESLG